MNLRVIRVWFSVKLLNLGSTFTSKKVLPMSLVIVLLQAAQLRDATSNPKLMGLNLTP